MGGTKIIGKEEGVNLGRHATRAPSWVKFQILFTFLGEPIGILAQVLAQILFMLPGEPLLPSRRPNFGSLYLRAVRSLQNYKIQLTSAPQT